MGNRTSLHSRVIAYVSNPKRYTQGSRDEGAVTLARLQLADLRQIRKRLRICKTETCCRFDALSCTSCKFDNVVEFAPAIRSTYTGREQNRHMCRFCRACRSQANSQHVANLPRNPAHPHAQPGEPSPADRVPTHGKTKTFSLLPPFLLSAVPRRGRRKIHP